MNKKIQATICLILAIFFISMPLSIPTATAGWSSCKQYQDEYENYDSIAYKYLTYQNNYEQLARTTGTSSFRYMYEIRAKYYASLVEEYGKLSTTYHQKYYECVEDMGTPVIIPTEHNNPTTYKFEEWTCIEEGNNNHCFRVRPRAMQFKLKSGQYVKMMVAINYQEWQGCDPYEKSASRYRKSNWYIGQDAATNCIYAINLYTQEEHKFCGEQTAKNLAPFVATIVSATAIATVSTATYMSLAGT